MVVVVVRILFGICFEEKHGSTPAAGKKLKIHENPGNKLPLTNVDAVGLRTPVKQWKLTISPSKAPSVLLAGLQKHHPPSINSQCKNPFRMYIPGVIS